MESTLETVRRLSEESRMGLAFCYRALKKFGFDYRRALEWLRSDQFRNSVWRK